MSETLTRTRSDERQRLHNAIAKHAAANVYHDRVDDVLSRKQNEIFDLNRAVEAAEERLAAAKEQEGARLVAALLDPPDQPTPSLADAEAALADIQQRLTVARADRERLVLELAKAGQAIAGTQRRVQEAVRSVVITEGGALELKRLHDQMAQQVVAIRQALNLVNFALPRNMNGQVIIGFPPAVDPSPLEVEWKAALLALETDADFPLPEIPE